MGGGRQPSQVGTMDKFSPIPEEPVAGGAPTRHTNTTINPLLSGSQTASTESNFTVRGTAMPHTPGRSPLSTPSYPFPHMNLEAGTPLDTPALHKPFTALSPTVTPSATKQAKGQTAREFMASGHLTPSSMRAFVPSSHPALQGSSPLAGPNLYDMMLRIQSEPGLPAFWTQVSQSLREHYGAERVILTIPSDTSDIENVPWAQLATYNAEEEESPSRIITTTEPQGTIFGMAAGVQEGIFADNGSERRSSPTNTRSTFTSGNLAYPTRPRLEARHSYAGYPLKSQATIPDPGTTLQASSRRPAPSRAGSQLSLRSGKPLEETALRSIDFLPGSLQRHDTTDSSRGPMSEVTLASSRPQIGNVLSSLQPLEMEAEPLLASAGVVRVLDRGKTVVLTRDYSDESQSAEHRQNKMSRRRVSGVQRWPNLNDTAGSTQLVGDQSQIMKPKSTAFTQRPRSQTSGSSQSSSAHQNSDDGLPRASYDDYEQISASAWSQSPAPSPAVQADPTLNPFFDQGSIDEGSFAEDPPDHAYGEEADIQAIGVDRAASVIHIPLIHPTISQTRRPQRLADQRKAKVPGQPSDKTISIPPTKVTQPSLTSSSESNKRMPIAIISILSNQNPYPVGLAESLESLAPILATALHNARQHSNLESEVIGLSQRRQLFASKSGQRDSQPFANISTTAGFSPSDSRERNFSPTSTSSLISEYSTTSAFSPHGSVSGGSVVGTPGWASNDLNERLSKHFSSSPVREVQQLNDHGESYFSQQLHSTPQGVENRPVPTPKDKVPEGQTGERKPKVARARSSDSTVTNPAKLNTVPVLSASKPEPGDSDFTFKEPSHSMLQTMIENGATQQFVAEPVRGTIVWANSKYQSYRNVSAAEIHKHPWKYIHPDEQRAFRKLWEKTLLSGDQISLTVRLKRFDGEYRWFHMKILPQKDKHGIIRHWHGQAMDTHEQHMAEIRAAREKGKAASEAKYRALANSNPHSIFAASASMGMTFANTQWLSYSGQTMEETLGFGFLDHVHPDDLVKCRFPGIENPLDLQAVKKLLMPRIELARQQSTASSGGENRSTSTAETDETVKAIPSSPSAASEVEAPSELLKGLVADGIIKCSRDGQGNLTVATEMRLKSKSGDYRWHLVQGSLIESVNFGQGDAQWFIACADITDQKQSEAKLKQANDALEKEMSRKMEYLSSMSHEIRTPLNGILGNLQFLTNSGLDEHQQDWVFGAQKAAQGMHSLINDILDVSKAEAKMLKLSHQWFSARSTLEEVMETLMSKATEKRLELCYEIAEDVPTSVNGDPGRIKQILLNLVGNAIKFTRNGEVWIKCDIPDPTTFNIPNELGRNEILLQFSVKDTGSGFNEEDAKLLFKPYSQIDNNDTRNIGGTGLGLILCRTMVELHGGEIWAESVPGKGATFTFYARFSIRDPTASTFSSESSRENTSVLPSPAIPGHILRGGVFESPGAVPRFSRSDQDSPALRSSGSSDPSSGSLSFHRSVRSSASTVDSAMDVASMKLILPTQPSEALVDTPASSTPRPPLRSPNATNAEARQETSIPKSPLTFPEAGAFRPPMLSILIVCPQENTRRTTQDHVQRVLPKSIPAQVTTEGDIKRSHEMTTGEDALVFTHIILQLSSATDVLDFMQQILDSDQHLRTCIVVVTDQAQKKTIMAHAPNHDYDQLSANDRLKFILKPAKPHKFAKIFDPGQENSQSADDQTRAELREKQLQQRTSYAMFKQVLGNKGIRALAVEDNNLNMEVCRAN